MKRVHRTWHKWEWQFIGVLLVICVIYAFALLHVGRVWFYPKEHGLVTIHEVSSRSGLDLPRSAHIERATIVREMGYSALWAKVLIDTGERSSFVSMARRKRRLSFRSAFRWNGISEKYAPQWWRRESPVAGIGASASVEATGLLEVLITPGAGASTAIFIFREVD